MKTTHVLGAVLVMLVMCWGAGTASAADKYFLQIPGVPGESTDSKHKHWIEVLSFSQEISRSPQLTVGPMIITKNLDEATPALSADCCSGKHYPQVVLQAAKSSGSKHVFFKYVLSDAVVRNIKAFTNDKGVLQQEVQFSFGKIQWHYPPSGSAPTAGGWDVYKKRAL